MIHEQTERDNPESAGNTPPRGGLSRRLFIAAAASGVITAAHGLLLPGGSDEALARSRNPARRVLERKDQQHRKRENARERQRREGRSSSARRRSPGDKPPQHCIVKVKDMQLIFQGGTRLTHTMDVSMGSPDDGEGYIVHWRNQSVGPGQEYRFVGWYPGMYLEVTSVQPPISFEAVNYCVLSPIMDIHRRDGTNEKDSRILKLGFSVGQKEFINGFSIERIEDGSEHKIFIIKALD